MTKFTLTRSNSINQSWMSSDQSNALIKNMLSEQGVQDNQGRITNSQLQKLIQSVKTIDRDNKLLALNNICQYFSINNLMDYLIDRCLIIVDNFNNTQKSKDFISNELLLSTREYIKANKEIIEGVRLIDQAKHKQYLCLAKYESGSESKWSLTKKPLVHSFLKDPKTYVEFTIYSAISHVIDFAVTQKNAKFSISIKYPLWFLAWSSAHLANHLNLQLKKPQELRVLDLVDSFYAEILNDFSNSIK